MTRLDLLTWTELAPRLESGLCVMLPMGSTEQHGPMGLIGTDAICATRVAQAAAERCDGLVAPPLAYSPAPFNTAFPGTVSLSEGVFEAVLQEVCEALLAQGFLGVFALNGHGANLAPARAVAARLPAGALQVQSWWDPAPVQALRAEMFGAWEGMHATPSEVAITQVFHGCKPPGAAVDLPQPLSAAYIRAHAGDRHGPPAEHRAAFPDGRVGSHSALATPELGQRLLDAAAEALAQDFKAFTGQRKATCATPSRA